MEVILNKKPKNAIIINGFPGFGLVGTIAAEFLLQHLEVEQIGKIKADEIPPVVAIHENKKVDPFGVFYNKKYNLIILHTIASTQGFEWKLAETILDLAKKIEAKEILSLEGLAGDNPEEFKTFFYSTDKTNVEKMKKNGVEQLKEGIIIGVTGAIMMDPGDVTLTCIFSETHSSLPDSKAAAKIIEGLDKYLGLNVDYAPLLKQAENFEQKLQSIIKKGMETTELSEKKKMSYVG